MRKPFTLVAAIIFLIMALAHAYRAVTHFQIILGSHTIPDWASIVGLLVAGILSYGLFRESRR
jgi:hypothetical protein